MTKPKILLFDIETSPLQIYAWQTYQTNALAVIENVKLLSVAWKWLGQKKIDYVGRPDFTLYDTDPSDDYAVVSTLRDLLDEADVVVAHNGDGFDIKRTNARIIVNELDPPSPYVSIDTLKVARRHFKFDSNRLNDLGRELGVGQKLTHTGFDLWKRCLDGDLTAWATMKKYNIQDVQLLEDVYLKLRPWIEGHPNMGLHFEECVCPNCGSTDVQQRGYKYTKTRRYKQFVCKSCKAWSRSRLVDKSQFPILTN